VFKELLNQLYTEQGLSDISDLDFIVRDLWTLPWREFQYVATSLIGKFEKQLPEEFIETPEYLLATKSW
jgi:hypothetical protein